MTSLPVRGGRQPESSVKPGEDVPERTAEPKQEKNVVKGFCWGRPDNDDDHAAATLTPRPLAQQQLLACSRMAASCCLRSLALLT